LARLKRPHELKIYPAFGDTPAKGHGAVYSDVASWEADVFRFRMNTAFPLGLGVFRYSRCSHCILAMKELLLAYMEEGSDPQLDNFKTLLTGGTPVVKQPPQRAAGPE